ncbi:MAG: hypothetical protein Q7K20_14365 [Polaromonas sp.]|nr:hypothetical protein [Polaromonas sp.]
MIIADFKKLATVMEAADGESLRSAHLLKQLLWQNKLAEGSFSSLSAEVSRHARSFFGRVLVNSGASRLGFCPSRLLLYLSLFL